MSSADPQWYHDSMKKTHILQYATFRYEIPTCHFITNKKSTPPRKHIETKIIDERQNNNFSFVQSLLKFSSFFDSHGTPLAPSKRQIIMNYWDFTLSSVMFSFGGCFVIRFLSFVNFCDVALGLSGSILFFHLSIDGRISMIHSIVELSYSVCMFLLYFGAKCLFRVILDSIKSQLKPINDNKPLLDSIHDKISNFTMKISQVTHFPFRFKFWFIQINESRLYFACHKWNVYCFWIKSKQPTLINNSTNHNANDVCNQSTFSIGAYTIPYFQFYLTCASSCFSKELKIFWHIWRNKGGKP